jgi:hypothetical protein
MKKTMPIVHLTVFLATLLAFAGCNNGGCTVSSSSSTELNVNGAKTGHKTTTQTKDGVTRRLETGTGVEVENGQVTKFPKGAVIKLQEEGGSQPRQAELREKDGNLELWIKDKGGFRRVSPEEDKWLENFLREITTK